MSGMWWFIIGVVLGGLSLWIYMRERELRLQAEIDATQHKKVAENLRAPAVKTRAIGEGSTSRSKRRSSRKPKPSEEQARDEKEAPAKERAVSEAEDASPDDSEQQADDTGEGRTAEEEPADAQEDGAGDDETKKKPKVSLKIPEPSSVSEVQDDSEE